jgi:hypothetical protein
MTELATGWGEVLASSDLPEILDAGMPGVIYAIGEALDPWAQTTFPPYALLVEACAAISGYSDAAENAELPGWDCEADRIRLRGRLITEALKLTGLYAMIEEIVKAWQRVPVELRQYARLAFDNASSVQDLLDDPSVPEAYRLAVDSLQSQQALMATLVNDLWDGVIPNTVVTRWLESAAGTGEAAITYLTAELPEDAANYLRRAASDATHWIWNGATSVASGAVDVGVGVVEEGVDFVRSLNPFG